MSAESPTLPEVFTVDEIARVAEVSAADVANALEADGISRVHGRYVPFIDAIHVVGTLRAAGRGWTSPRRLFAPHRTAKSRTGVPLAASGALHAGALAVMVLIAGLGVRSEPTEPSEQETVHLVFLTTPGPGGGGGGGGLRDPRPAPAAAVEGRSKLRSPVSVSRETRPEPPTTRVETPPPVVVPEPAPEPVPPPPAPAPTPPVVAPVVTAPSDVEDRAGVVTAPAAPSTSHGSGTGGGTGSGQGTGSGEGTGAGIGPGSTAGIGGGPYRPGAGITPPICSARSSRFTAKKAVAAASKARSCSKSSSAPMAASARFASSTGSAPGSMPGRATP